MKYKQILKSVRYISILLLAAVNISCSRSKGYEKNRKQKPNIIILLADDMGYSDVGVFGAKGLTTPNLDRMASQGMRFTAFYDPANVCTPSRVGLLTGRYPERAGLTRVIFPRDTIGLSPDEVTIAEMLKQKDYVTQAIGKWHLGAHPKFLPTNQGFDHFYGLPYSNDMSSLAKYQPNVKTFPPLPLLQDTTIIEREPDQALLTRHYTEHAVDFIKNNKNSSFFLYMAYNAPHVPLYASKRFQGSTNRGPYGDVVHELDWSVGQILDTIKKLSLQENTFIIFYSDNGPWLVYGDYGGTADGFRGGKITTFEGGHRVPAIAMWLGKIPAGSVSDLEVTSMDLMPTIARVTRTKLPDERIIDGHDIWPILSGTENTKSPYDKFYYYSDQGDQLRAIRQGKWKLHISHKYLAVKERGSGGHRGVSEVKVIERSLYNLKEDPAESNNVADKHPEIVDRLMRVVKQGRNELGDLPTHTSGTDRGKPGTVNHYWKKLDKN